MIHLAPTLATTMGDTDWTIDLTSAPSVEPVSRVEAKLHLNVDKSSDDDLIDAIITASRIYCENQLHRAFITQTHKLYMNRFPGEILVPRPPLQSVTSITYVDTDGTSQTVTASDYQEDITSEPGRIKPAFGSSWPSPRDQYKSITVTLVAGYGDAATDVPRSIVSAIKLLVGQLYMFREPVITGTIVAKLPFTFQALLETERYGYKW